MSREHLRAWLDTFLWVCEQTSNADTRTALYSGKCFIELPADIFEVFKSSQVLSELLGHYLFEPSDFTIPPIKLLPNLEAETGLFLKVSENNEA